MRKGEQLWNAMVVPVEGLEPPFLAERDFESRASTSSATRACGTIYIRRPARRAKRKSAGPGRACFRLKDRSIAGGCSGDAEPAAAAALAIFVGSTATIVGAWFFEFVLRLPPCPLCLEQRLPYHVVIALSLL